MKRKVIQQRNSFTITLPKKWVKEHGIDKCKEITIDDEKEGLYVRTDAIPQKEGELKIDSNNRKYIVMVLNNAYRSGYDTLKISISNEKTAEIIEKQLSLLLGWQITERAPTQIVIENLTEPTTDKFDSLLRRVFLVIKHDLEELKQIILKGKGDIANIKKNAEEIIRIDNFLRRCISKKVVEKEKTMFYWSLISTITWVHRSIYYLVCDIEKENTGITIPVNDKTIQNLIDTEIKAFTSLYEGFFSNNMDKISSVMEIINEIQENKDKYLTAKRNTQLIVYYFIEMSRLTNFSCSPCLGILA